MLTIMSLPTHEQIHLSIIFGFLNLSECLIFFDSIVIGIIFKF